MLMILEVFFGVESYFEFFFYMLVYINIIYIYGFIYKEQQFFIRFDYFKIVIWEVLIWQKIR